MAVEQFSHFEAICDGCQDVLCNEEGGIMVFESEEETFEELKSYDWMVENEGAENQRILCENCAEGEEEQHEASKYDEDEDYDDE